MYTEETAQVTRYAWELYHQAIQRAKAKHFRNPNQSEFDAACTADYVRLMQSPETETVTIRLRGYTGSLDEPLTPGERYAEQRAEMRAHGTT